MARTVSCGPDGRVGGLALAQALEALRRAAAEAIQLHGGIGFTWEHDLHLHLRRARADSVLYGDAAVHRDRLCTLLRRTPASASA